MGPRFFKRGESMAWSSLAARRRFNGATLLQAWRVSIEQRQPRHRNGFNGATLLQAWRAGEAKDKVAA